MNKFRTLSINKKMMLSLIGLIIIPLIVIGVTVSEFVYHHELQLSCRSYKEKLIWTCGQVESAFLDAENIALTFYLDEAAQSFFKEKRINSRYSSHVSNLIMEQTRNKDWYRSVCVTVDDLIMKQWENGVILDRDDQTNIDETYKQETHGFWTGPRSLDNVVSQNKTEGESVLTFYGKIFDYLYFQNILGVVSVSISEDYISRLCSGNLLADEGVNMLLAQDGRVISANIKEMLGETYDSFDEIKDRLTGKDGYFTARLDGRPHVIFYEESGKYDWKLVSIMPESSLSYDNRLTIITIVICIVLCILFGLCFGFVLKKTILRPLTVLADKMYHTHSLKSGYDEEIGLQDEIGILYRSFVKMESNINEMIQKNYVSEIYRKEAEIQKLLVQINPHFLYNTLDSIYWFAAQKKEYAVADKIATLSDIFRHSLQMSDKLATISEEVTFIQKYVELMQMQTSGEIEFLTEIDDELLEYKIPRLLLQPLVENVFLHGLKDKVQGCMIISVELIGEKLYLTVSDDGAGTDEKEVWHELDSPGHGENAFALKNVNQRIRLMFGDSYGLEFHSVIGEGTTVILVLPKKMEILEEDREKSYENDDY